MGAKLLLGEEKRDVFDAQVAFEIACKVRACISEKEKRRGDIDSLSAAYEQLLQHPGC